MRLVVDTNVLVSAFLWQGTPGRLIELVGEKEIALYTSRALIEELSEVLHRKKLSKQVAATGLSAAQMIRNYRRLAIFVTSPQLARQVSRDADDDAVLACALATHVDFIVSGDKDLLVLKAFNGTHIITAAQAIQAIVAR